MKRSTIFKLLLLVGFSFMLGFSYDYHLPKLEGWLLVEIERFSREKTPVRIYAKKLRFHLLPLGVVLENVDVQAQAPLDKYFAPAKIRQAGIRLAIWPLLRGEVRLSQIYVRGSEFNIFLKNDLFAGQKSPEKFRVNFEQIYRLPVDEISLEDIRIQGRLDPQNVVFRVSDLNVLVENRYKSLFVELNAPNVLVKPSGPVNPLNVQLELRSLIEAHEMQISAFKLKADESFVVASGRFNGDFAVGEVENGAFDARTKLQLSDLNVWEKIFFLEPKLPALRGHAELDIGTEVRKSKGYQVEVDVNTQDVGVDQYVIGSIRGHLASDLKNLTSKSLILENNSGKIELEKLAATLEEPKRTASALVRVHRLDVKKFLENIDVKHVPVQLPIKGEAQCDGVWSDDPSLICRGRLTSQKLSVDTGESKHTKLVELEDTRLKGEVKVNSKQVEYNVNMDVGKNSSGTSDGIINYNTGFKINFNTNHLEFADVKNLVNLKFEGATKLKGTTIGTSKWATIDLNADSKDLWLEDYPLGSSTARLTYKAGILKFEDLVGQFEVTRYNGRVELDIIKERIRISGQIPFMDLKDIQAMFKRKVTLPIQMSGTGTGHLEAEGPLSFPDMSYEFRSNFYRGQVSKETFDDLTFQVKSVNGLVKSQKIFLTKGHGVIEVKGQINPKGEIDTVAVGRNMRLEQSENIVGLGLDLQGLADFTVLIRGQLPKPRVELNGRLSKVVIADVAAEDSVFKVNFLSDRMEGSGQFLGSKLISDFTYPYDNNGPFMFKLKTTKWDFTSTFSLLSRSAQQLDFATSVSMDIDLRAPTGGFWNSTGKALLTEFTIRKGGKILSAEKPMELVFKSGTVNSENFNLVSGESFLKLDVAGLTRTAFNASLNGKIDLALLGVFTPFISDLRGNMALSVDLRGSAEKPLLSGSAYIDRGYAKFADFIHPFSNARADILFNDNQLLLNAVRADFAGGKLGGEGKVTFSGNTRPIDIKGRFTDVRLNVPEGFRTNGSGTVAIRGDRFPYTMDIVYDITGGEVTYDFTDPGNAVSTVKASPYLPRFLDESAFHPFTFLLDLNTKNPVTVNNPMIQGSTMAQLRGSGTPDHLLLNGTVSPLPGGKLTIGDRIFDVNSAFIEYNQAPPNDPKIYVTASARVLENVIDEQNRSQQNQYDVSLLVQGHGKDPQFQWTSQPALSQREIISLVTLGTTGSTNSADERKTTGVQNANTSTAVGAAIFQKAAGRKVKESLGVDVKVTSQTSVDNNTMTPKVTLSKQLSPKFGASASSTIEGNPNNNVKIEYKVNKNVSAVGSWDSRENLHDTKKDTDKNILGLDLQYRFQFK